jgi:hypothetical protein
MEIVAYLRARVTFLLSFCLSACYLQDELVGVAAWEGVVERNEIYEKKGRGEDKWNHRIGPL